jgi:hypothetical protein
MIVADSRHCYNVNSLFPPMTEQIYFRSDLSLIDSSNFCRQNAVALSLLHLLSNPTWVVRQIARLTCMLSRINSFIPCSVGKAVSVFIFLLKCPLVETNLTAILSAAELYFHIRTSTSRRPLRTSLNGIFRSGAASRGMRRTRSLMAFLAISVVPPPMLVACRNR